MPSTAPSEQAHSLPAAGQYAVDPARTAVSFTTRHLFGLAAVRGTFPVRSGRLTIAEALADSTVEAEIDVAGLATGNPRRDDDVRSARFLDAESYPVIAFTGSRLLPRGGGWALSGTLRVRDVTRPVDLDLSLEQAGPGSFTVRTTRRIDRYDYGITTAKGMAGRYLDVSIVVTATVESRPA
jgi:polyisoprenoid-binding protein YceI